LYIGYNLFKFLWYINNFCDFIKALTSQFSLRFYYVQNLCSPLLLLNFLYVRIRKLSSLFLRLYDTSFFTIKKRRSKVFACLPWWKFISIILVDPLVGSFCEYCARFLTYLFWFNFMQTPRKRNYTRLRYQKKRALVIFCLLFFWYLVYSHLYDPNLFFWI